MTEPTKPTPTWQVILLTTIFVAGIYSWLINPFGVDSKNTKSAAIAENLKTQETDHYYSMKDGYLYGYEQAVSQNDNEQGKAANTLLMFRYSGFKDGIYQVYTKDDVLDVITVMECKNPCDFLKITIHVKLLDKPKVQHMRMTPDTIAWAVFNDAMNGKLDEVVLEKNGEKNSMWISENGALYQAKI